MEKKVLIYGMGLGAGFAKVSQHEKGYEICIQYRSSESKKEYEGDYDPTTRYMKSDLKDTDQIEQELLKLKNDGFIPDYIFQTAGSPMTDKKAIEKEMGPFTPEQIEEISIAKNKEVSFDNKVTTYEASRRVYNDPLHPVKFFMVDSKAGAFTLEEARGFGEVGYSTGMKMITDFAQSRNDPGLEVYAIHPENNVDSRGLKAFSKQIEEASGDVIPQGEDPRIFAREIFEKYGL